MFKNNEDLLDDIVEADLRDTATVQFTAFDGGTVYQTADPANIQAILATQFKDFEVGQWRYHTFKPLLGLSIFTSDGAFWEHSRGLFRPQFARENINDLETTDKACNQLIEAIGSVESQGWTEGTEMLPLLYNFTLDTATDFLFGETIESQQVAIAARRGPSGDVERDAEQADKIEHAKKFSSSFEIINGTMMSRIIYGTLRFLGDGLQFRRSIRYVKNFTERFVELAVEHPSFSEKPDTKKQSLLQNLATQTQDRTELRNQTLSILLAGRDTTAAILGWCLTRLALQPEIFAKLRGIILQEFHPNQPITFAQLKGCRYLQDFLSEVLRLHPVVPMNNRAATKDTTIPVGGGPDGRSPIAIRKGEVVNFCVYNMQRRPELWGEDGEDFKPERWEQRYPGWQFLPFLGGPRICLGQQYALTEAGYLVVRLLHEFDAIEPVNKEQMRMLRKGYGVTMWPRDKARVRFRKAAQSPWQ